MPDLVAQVRESISRQGLIAPGARLLVAVSAGVDSMVLLEILHRLAPRHHWILVVGHLNHRLRARSSDADERLVRDTARHLGWRCVTARANVRQFAARKKISMEMAARELRHRFLARAAGRCGAKWIATAHHADDQVELFFLRLLRGAGTQGLGGMKWSTPSPATPEVQIVRPLLNIPKSELARYARSEGVAFREDATNRSTDILRNRIRHELLPLLARRFQPALAKVILRQMKMIRDEAEAQDEAASAWLKGKRRAAFETTPVALQRRVLYRQALQLGAAADFELIEKLRRQSETPVLISPRLALVRNRHGQLRRHQPREHPFVPARQRVKLKDGVNAGKFNGIVWQAKATRWRGRLPPRQAATEWFDAERIGQNVILRHWRSGDRFQPIGMSQPVKLQDLFTNLKVPAASRRQRVVATTATGELWWVEGLRIAERFKIRPQTRRALKWKWHRGIERTDAKAAPPRNRLR